jgi:hypothetical protein
MPILKAPPGASYYVNARSYTATSAGLLSAHEDDIGQLIASGCVAFEPWSRTAAQAPPPEPEAVKPAPRKVRLRAPRPHMTFAPESGSTVRYASSAESYFDAAPEHVDALICAGCKRV